MRLSDAAAGSRAPDGKVDSAAAAGLAEPKLGAPGRDERAKLRAAAAVPVPLSPPLGWAASAVPTEEASAARGVVVARGAVHVAHTSDGARRTSNGEQRDK